MIFLSGNIHCYTIVNMSNSLKLSKETITNRSHYGDLPNTEWKSSSRRQVFTLLAKSISIFEDLFVAEDVPLGD